MVVFSKLGVDMEFLCCVKVCRITAYKVFHVQPEDGHCQVRKHVVVPYVVNTFYTSTIK